MRGSLHLVSNIMEYILLPSPNFQHLSHICETEELRKIISGECSRQTFQYFRMHAFQDTTKLMMHDKFEKISVLVCLKN